MYTNNIQSDGGNMAHPLRQAVVELEGRIRGITHKIDQMLATRATMESTIQHLQNFIDEDERSPDRQVVQGWLDSAGSMGSLEEALASPSNKAWEVARDVLHAAGKPLTVPEIDAALGSRPGKPTRDSLRISMIRRTDVFQNIGGGAYGLVGWNVLKPGLDEWANPGATEGAAVAAPQV